MESTSSFVLPRVRTHARNTHRHPRLSSSTYSANDRAIFEQVRTVNGRQVLLLSRTGHERSFFFLRFSRCLAPSQGRPSPFSKKKKSKDTRRDGPIRAGKVTDLLSICFSGFCTTFLSARRYLRNRVKLTPVNTFFNWSSERATCVQRLK